MASPRKGGNYASTSDGRGGSLPWQMQTSLLQQYGQLYLDGMLNVNEQTEEEPTATDAEILEAATFLDGKTQPNRGGNPVPTSDESSRPWQIQNSLLQQYRQLFLDGMSNKYPDGGTTMASDMDPLGASTVPDYRAMNFSNKRGDYVPSHSDSGLLLNTRGDYLPSHADSGLLLNKRGDYVPSHADSGPLLNKRGDYLSSHADSGPLLNKRGDYVQSQAHRGPLLNKRSDYIQSHADSSHLLDKRSDYDPANAHSSSLLNKRSEYGPAHVESGPLLNKRSEYGPAHTSSGGSQQWQVQNSVMQQYGDPFQDRMGSKQTEREITAAATATTDTVAKTQHSSLTTMPQGLNMTRSDREIPEPTNNDSHRDTYNQMLTTEPTKKDSHHDNYNQMVTSEPTNKDGHHDNYNQIMTSELNPNKASHRDTYNQLTMSEPNKKEDDRDVNDKTMPQEPTNKDSHRESYDQSVPSEPTNKDNHRDAYNLMMAPEVSEPIKKEDNSDSYNQMLNYSSALTQQYFLSQYGNTYMQALSSFIDGSKADGIAKDLRMKKGQAKSTDDEIKDLRIKKTPPKLSEETAKDLRINFKKTPTKSSGKKVKPLRIKLTPKKSPKENKKQLFKDTQPITSDKLELDVSDEIAIREKLKAEYKKPSTYVRPKLDKIVRPRTMAEARLGCTCATFCLDQFTTDAVELSIQCIRDMKKDDKEMLVMTSLITFGHGMTRGGKRKRNRYRYTYEDKVVCKTSYCFVYNISIKTLKALQRHLVENGPVPRIHGNKGKKPYHALSYEEVKFCVEYLLDYTNTHGNPMPEAATGPSVFPPVWLPTNPTKQHIHTLYSEACLAVPIRAIGLSSFRGVWNNCLHHVHILGPKDDIPTKCEEIKNKMSVASEQERLQATLNLIDLILKKEEEQKNGEQKEQKDKSTDSIDDDDAHDETHDDAHDEDTDEYDDYDTPAEKKARNSTDSEKSASPNKWGQYKKQDESSKKHEEEKAKRMADFMYFEPLSSEQSNGEHKEKDAADSKFEPPKDDQLLYTHCHNEVTTFICIVCEKAFLDSSTLKSHMKIHSEQEDKKFQCHFCDEAFLKMGALNAHMRLHTGEKPFECEFCDKAFGDNSSLLSHLKTHTGEKPFICKVCDKSFTLNSALCSHMRLHSDEKPYECEVCGKKLKQNAAFVKHMRLHTGEDPYQCPHCEKTFYDKSNMNQHIKEHTVDKPYKCAFCVKEFKHKGSFIKHMKLHTGEAT